MTVTPRFHATLRLAGMGSFLLVLGACTEPLDFDLRGQVGAFNTTEAALGAPTASRPEPDARGLITYPTYQVAVARRGDTVTSIAARLGINAEELGRFNGIEPDVTLRDGEVLALPRPVPASTGASRPGSVDIAALAGAAIDGAPATAPVTTTALPPAAAAPAPVQRGPEPVRHKVGRGETAYTIARLYQVSVKSLAEWNGLGPDFTIREGQYLLIPVANAAAPSPALSAAAAATAVTEPGSGSPTPTPPSAATPLPDERVAAAATPVAVPETRLSQPSSAAVSSAAMSYPVTGRIIRAYQKGRNDGIDIAAAPGTAVQAAADGTVAAITKDADGVPIVVLRHPDGLLTVYANVTDVRVEKDENIKRGQPIGALRGGDAAYVHFEVRQGFDSVDPIPYLE